MRRGVEEILQLAETVSKWDLDSEEGYAAFRRFARQAKIKEENLAYYSNAYEAAGESGLKALTHKKRMPENVRIEATRKINEFLAGRLPKRQGAVNKISFQVTAKGNRITGAEKRPLFGDPTQSALIVFMSGIPALTGGGICIGNVPRGGGGRMFQMSRFTRLKIACARLRMTPPAVFGDDFLTIALLLCPYLSPCFYFSQNLKKISIPREILPKIS